MPRQQGSHNQTRSAKSAPTSFQVTGPVLPRPLDHQAPATASFGQIFKEGLGFGAGSAVARQVVDRIFASVDSSPSPPVPVKKEDPIMSSFLTDEQRVLYNQCILEGGTHNHCKELLQ